MTFIISSTFESSIFKQVEIVPTCKKDYFVAICVVEALSERVIIKKWSNRVNIKRQKKENSCGIIYIKI